MPSIRVCLFMRDVHLVAGSLGAAESLLLQRVTMPALLKHLSQALLMPGVSGHVGYMLSPGTAALLSRHSLNADAECTAHHGRCGLLHQ